MGSRCFHSDQKLKSGVNNRKCNPELKSLSFEIDGCFLYRKGWAVCKRPMLNVFSGIRLSFNTRALLCTRQTKWQRKGGENRPFKAKQIGSNSIFSEVCFSAPNN